MITTARFRIRICTLLGRSPSIVVQHADDLNYFVRTKVQDMHSQREKETRSANNSIITSFHKIVAFVVLLPERSAVSAHSV